MESGVNCFVIYSTNWRNETHILSQLNRMELVITGEQAAALLYREAAYPLSLFQFMFIPHSFAWGWRQNIYWTRFTLNKKCHFFVELKKAVLLWTFRHKYFPSCFVKVVYFFKQISFNSQTIHQKSSQSTYFVYLYSLAGSGNKYPSKIAYITFPSDWNWGNKATSFPRRGINGNLRAASMIQH